MSANFVNLPKTFDRNFHTCDSTTGYGNGVIKYSRLGKTDMIVSNLGLGGAAFCDIYGKTDQKDTSLVVREALKAGINYIDTAPWYGQSESEKRLGIALKNIPRNTYYIATKVGRYETDVEKMFDYSSTMVLKRFEKSLELLHLDYVDLIQIHDVEFCINLDQIINHTLPALLELKRQGKVRWIGLSGYNLSVLERIVGLAPPGSIDTILSYARLNLFNQDLLNFEEYFVSRDIGIINASSLGLGLLCGSLEFPAWHPANLPIKKACADAAKYCKSQGLNLAELALEWSLLQDNIPVNLVSMTSYEQLCLNLATLRKLALDYDADKFHKVLEPVMRYLNNLTCSHWENIEVCKYWAKMESLGYHQNLG